MGPRFGLDQLPEPVAEIVMAQKKATEAMKVEFRGNPEDDDYDHRSICETRLVVARGMLDPVGLCEVSFFQRIFDDDDGTMTPAQMREAVKQVRSGAAAASHCRPPAATAADKLCFPPQKPWEVLFKVPVRGLEAVRALILAKLRGQGANMNLVGGGMTATVTLRMGGVELAHRTYFPDDNENEHAVELLDMATDMLTFLCTNG